MNAAKFIGRVGGLAVALGVSAAAFSGSAVAWADSSSAGADSPSSAAASSAADAGSPAASTGTTSPPASPSGDDSAPATPSRAGTHSGPRASNSYADADSGNSASVTPEADLQARDIDAHARTPHHSPRATAEQRVATSEQAADPAESSAPVTQPALGPSAPQPEAVVSAPVSATRLDGSGDGPSPDPFTGNSPATPADSPLDVALLAATRRESAAAPLSVEAAATTQQQSAVSLAATNTALIMGPSGVPIPSDQYIASVYQLYVEPNSPAGTVPDALFTPEGLYPITGVKSLPLNTSVDQGLTILDDAIRDQLVAGNTVTVFGYSQSAIISSLEMSQLDPSTPIEFILTGNEMNPDGGLLSRFPNLTIPSLGLDFYGATPSNAFPTTNYTLEYDGFADFPRYPLNFLADLNAGFGIVFVHTQYAKLTQDQVTPVSLGGQAIELPTSSPTQHYFIIPNADLPLLEPLRAVPLIGNPIADLLQPALRVIVNLGYGDPAYGWSTGTNANEETTFGLFPSVDWISVASDLIAGTAQGFKNFTVDVGPGGSLWNELGSLSLAVPNQAAQAASLVTDFFSDPISTIQQLVTDVSNKLNSAAAASYAALLPTADIANSLVTTLPAYDVNLYLDGIQQVLGGDPVNGLVNAVGRPIAADVGLGTVAGLVELLAVLQAVQGVLT